MDNTMAMESTVSRIFQDELQVDPQDHNVLLTEPAMNPKRTREALTEILMETFNVRAMLLTQSPVLSLHSTGRTTGLIVDCSLNHTQCLSILDGSLSPHSVINHPIGGHHITKYLHRILQDKGYTVSYNDVNWIKE